MRLSSILVSHKNSTSTHPYSPPSICTGGLRPPDATATDEPMPSSCQAKCCHTFFHIPAPSPIRAPQLFYSARPLTRGNLGCTPAHRTMSLCGDRPTFSCQASSIFQFTAARERRGIGGRLCGRSGTLNTGALGLNPSLRHGASAALRHISQRSRPLTARGLCHEPAPARPIQFSFALSGSGGTLVFREPLYTRTSDVVESSACRQFDGNVL